MGYTGPKVNYYCNTNMLVSSNKNLSYQGVADLLGYGTIVGHIQQYSTVWEGDVIDYRIINNNSEYINSNIDLIFSNNQYWLSTSYRALHSLYSTEDMENMGYYYEEEGIYYDDQWGLYFVDNTKVSGTFFANSDISPTDGGPYAIRPIVELNSNVKFTYENGVINLQ